MSKLAIDVALLPPKEIMRAIIDLNNQNEPTLTFNEVDRLPHITLLQAVADDNDLNNVSSIMSEISANFQPLNLSAQMVEAPRFDSYRITPTPEIMKFHTELMDRLNATISYDAKADYFIDKEVQDFSVDWIKNFKQNSSYDKFDPHITFLSQKHVAAPPIKFTADRLSICHLGDYNTCRKILFETKLGI